MKILPHFVVGFLCGLIFRYILENTYRCAFQHRRLVFFVYVIFGGYFGTLILAIAYPVINSLRTNYSLDEDMDILEPHEKNNE